MLRREAERRLAGLVAAAGHGGRRSGIVFLDVDGFTQINDRLGHEAGERVLSEAADRLVSGVRPDDVVARFGGDEFILLRPGIGTEAALTGRAAELAAAIAGPIPVHGQPLRTGVSIGATMIPRDGASAADVLAAADAAMYEAKRTGGDIATRAGSGATGQPDARTRWTVRPTPDGRVPSDGRPWSCRQPGTSGGSPYPHEALDKRGRSVNDHR